MQLFQLDINVNFNFIFVLSFLISNFLYERLDQSTNKKVYSSKAFILAAFLSFLADLGRKLPALDGVLDGNGVSKSSE